MEEIHRIRKISIWIFVIPIIVLNSCLFISINYHLFVGTIFHVDQVSITSFTIPYIDGSVSISRSARGYPNYLLFKPGMIITAVLLIQYWIANNKLFQSINSKNGKNKYFLLFGVGSALFLILGIKQFLESFKFIKNCSHDPPVSQGRPRPAGYSVKIYRSGGKT